MKLNRAVTQIPRAKLECLGNPCSGVVEQCKEQPVSASGECRGIGGGEHRIDLGTGHETEHRFYRLLLRNSQKAVADADEVQCGRLPKDKTHKGADGGQPEVARPRGIASLVFQMSQKREDSLRAHGAERELVDGFPMVA